MPDPVRYAVDLANRDQHLVHVTMTVPADVAPGGRIVLPTWTPGSYVVRDYVHHLQRITARTDSGAVPLRPDGRTAWRLPDQVDGSVEVTLELYANELTVRTNHVDDHHALLVPPATFPYVEDAEGRQHLVHLPAPEGQRAFSLLPDGDEPDVYAAQDYLELVDSAFEVGDHDCVRFEVAGVPHRLVWAGHDPAPDLDRLAGDAAALCGAAAELMGGDLPVDRYTFLVLSWQDRGGGLEHRNGAVLEFPLRSMHDQDSARRLQSLVAHEYLHLWNVKRLVPAALVDLDLVEPSHTESLWVAEGWTSYYDRLLPLRAGLWTLEQFLDKLGSGVQRILESPAAAVQSVREASWQAWVKHYVRDENSINASVDYYGHGAILAWCLDLLIRREDPAGNGLDTALRLLWDRFGDDGGGYAESDVEKACNEAAGTDLSWFFERVVDSPAVPPVGELVDAVGLRLVEEPDEARPPSLGVEVREDGDAIVLSSVLRGGPAWRAGLTGQDRLLAIDGLKVDAGQLETALRAHDPGTVVEVTVFRGPRLVTAQVELDDPRSALRLRAGQDHSTSQRTAFRQWTGRDVDEIQGD